VWILPDPNLPLNTFKTAEEEAPKDKDTHRRARLHWQTLRQGRSNSLCAKPLTRILWCKNLKSTKKSLRFVSKGNSLSVWLRKEHGIASQRSIGVRVIDTKRANRGGIIFARLKMTHDDLADAVDRMLVKNSLLGSMSNVDYESSHLL
jgi:hypothetical protein